MAVLFHEKSGTFHLQNERISYLICILPGGEIGQLYFGRRLHDRESYGELLEASCRAQAAYPQGSPEGWSLEHLKQELPSFGDGDFRQGALEILQANGSRVTHFRYRGHTVLEGKPALEGLPATYTESGSEAQTLVLKLEDAAAGLQIDLLYTIFEGRSVIARSLRVHNAGTNTVFLNRVMSLCLDLPDSDYEWMQFSGSWARERMPVARPLAPGMVSIESMRGHSSHQHNPFVILKRPSATEQEGEAMGCALLYSGNFQISAQVDAHRVTRLMAGINPTWFSWKLDPGESFQAPEAVLAYSRNGLNALSQDLHRLYQRRLARGVWRDRPRPILINNWEATYFAFDQEKLLTIARKAKECGVELFVLDDGWFGSRRSDHAGLGDWVPAKELLPEGVKGLSEQIEALGMGFGLWIEPEMVNPDSDLYREHPDWCLQVPGRTPSLSRNQLVLDFAREDVAEHIYQMLYAVLRDTKISYIKWDMNRSITDCYSAAYPPEQQGEIYHRYIRNVYRLYERLIREFPEILFESCAGGGGRFDAGMLYYAPQAWTSDNTDAVDRLRIQYATSYGYPLSCMGSHVSAVPNHQVGRYTSLQTRAETAFFGTFGYELDLNTLTEQEIAGVKACTRFMKEHRRLLQFGTFYRLQSPFDHNDSAWMVVSEDQRQAIVGVYRTLSGVNAPFSRIRLQGLLPERCYRVRMWEMDAPAAPASAKPSENCFYGDELMYAGLVTSDASSGKTGCEGQSLYDYSSRIYLLEDSRKGSRK